MEKIPHLCLKRVGDVDSGGVANLSWAGWVIFTEREPHDPLSGVVMTTVNSVRICECTGILKKR